MLRVKYSHRGERLLNTNTVCINNSYFDKFVWKVLYFNMKKLCFIISYKEYDTEYVFNNIFD